MSGAGKRVFISYGHDCAEIVERIRRDLETRGHDVWVDAAKIRAGRDWRAQITEGILNSDVVLAFLSRHALRPQGVCLQELAIAVGCRYGRVRTVLLEPGIESLIPSTVSGIQYVDLGRWREAKELGAEHFGAWYERAFEAVAALVEDDEAGFDGQLALLAKALSPTLMSSRRNTELVKPFTERPVIEQSLRGWLETDRSNPFYVLVGPPGYGKSAFMAHYSHYSPVITAAVFCEWGCANYIDTRQILRSVAYQIAAKVPTYRLRLARLLETSSLNLSTCPVRELFDLLFLHSTYGDIAQDDAIVVVIDGIDEASSRGINELSDLLASFAPRLPRFLKFVITTTDDMSVLQYFGGYDALRLDGDSPEMRGEVLAYLEDALSDVLADLPPWRAKKTLRKLAARCEGSFLYAELLANTMLHNGASVEDALSLPTGLRGIYFDWIQRAFPGETIFDDNYYDALCVIAASRTPLPTSMLNKLFGLRGVKLRRLLNKIRPFFSVTSDELGEPCVHCFHSSFLRWASGEEAGMFELDVEEGLTKLVEVVCASFLKGSMSRYEIEEALDILERGGSEDAADELRASDEYVCHLVELGRRYESAPSLQERALGAYKSALRILENRSELSGAARAARAGLLCAIGRCQLAMGFYLGALETLTSGADDIRELCCAQDRMTALSCLGSLYDWKGDRARSVDCFERLDALAREQGSDHWKLAATIGLVWNDHFTNLDSALRRIESIDVARLDRDERAMYDLCLARTLLSAGRLDEAIEKFERSIEGFDFGGGRDPHMFHKNRLLLVEALPAYYDTGRVEEGIEQGRAILRAVEDQGWLEESYCAFWLAQLSIKAGDLDAGEQYLDRAIACNGADAGSGNSSWMTMNIEGGYAKVAFERQRLDEALARRQRVYELATGACQDPWVAGDACFDICLILQLLKPGGEGGNDCDALLRRFSDELERIAEETGFAHHLGKSLLVRAYEQAAHGEGSPLELLRQAREVTNGYYVAALDKLVATYYEYRTRRLCGEEVPARRDLEKALQERLDSCSSDAQRTGLRTYCLPKVIREEHGIDVV